MNYRWFMRGLYGFLIMALILPPHPNGFAVDVGFAILNLIIICLFETWWYLDDRESKK